MAPDQPRFNIALRPSSLEIGEKLVNSAAAYAPKADGYLLGKEALPHVTLCQFRATDEKAAQTAFDSWPGPRQMNVTLGGLKVNAGVAEHQGKSWVAFDADREQGLLDLQKSLREHLEAAGFETLTATEGYNPHFTLARCEGPVEPPKDNPPALPSGLYISCNASLGQCSENGVFIRPIVVSEASATTVHKPTPVAKVTP